MLAAFPMFAQVSVYNNIVFQQSPRRTSFSNFKRPQVLHANYQIELISGENKVYGEEFHSNNPFSITKFSFLPIPGHKGWGITAAYIDETIPTADRYFYISPRYYFQTRHGCVMYGFRYHYSLKYDEGPTKDRLQPLIAYKYGNLEKLYISIDIFSENVFGVLNISMNYIFPDKYSSISLGYVNTKRGIYNGLSYRLNYKVYKRFMFVFQGNLHNKHYNTGMQAGLGVLW